MVADEAHQGDEFGRGVLESPQKSDFPLRQQGDYPFIVVVVVDT
jgi:hypothetical protein